MIMYEIVGRFFPEGKYVFCIEQMVDDDGSISVHDVVAEIVWIEDKQAWWINSKNLAKPAYFRSLNDAKRFARKLLGWETYKVVDSPAYM